MQITSNYNQANFNGFRRLANTSRKFKPNVLIRKAQPKPKTVVILPDGTIDTGMFAKTRERINEFFEKILFKILH